MSVFSAMIDAIYRTPGMSVEATYDGNPVRVVVSHDLSTWGEEISVRNGMVIVAVRKSQVAERPRRGDVFALAAGPQYTVEQTQNSDELEHRCLCLEHSA